MLSQVWTGIRDAAGQASIGGIFSQCQPGGVQATSAGAAHGSAAGPVRVGDQVQLDDGTVGTVVELEMQRFLPLHITLSNGNSKWCALGRVQNVIQRGEGRSGNVEGIRTWETEEEFVTEQPTPGRKKVSRDSSGEVSSTPALLDSKQLAKEFERMKEREKQLVKDLLTERQLREVLESRLRAKDEEVRALTERLEKVEKGGRGKGSPQAGNLHPSTLKDPEKVKEILKYCSDQPNSPSESARGGPSGLSAPPSPARSVIASNSQGPSPKGRLEARATSAESQEEVEVTSPEVREMLRYVNASPSLREPDDPKSPKPAGGALQGKEREVLGYVNSDVMSEDKKGQGTPPPQRANTPSPKKDETPLHDTTSVEAAPGSNSVPLSPEIPQVETGWAAWDDNSGGNATGEDQTDWATFDSNPGEKATNEAQEKSEAENEAATEASPAEKVSSPVAQVSSPGAAVSVPEASSPASDGFVAQAPRSDSFVGEDSPSRDGFVAEASSPGSGGFVAEASSPGSPGFVAQTSSPAAQAATPEQGSSPGSDGTPEMTRHRSENLEQEQRVDIDAGRRSSSQPPVGREKESTPEGLKQSVGSPSPRTSVQSTE